MSDTAPIVVFAYNRIHHLIATIDALEKNPLSRHSILYIYCDGAKSVAEQTKTEAVFDYSSTVSGFSEVHVVKREVNVGLSENIIQGVTEIVERHGKVIVLEDDLISSPYFLAYMNRALEIYENDPLVASIHGYLYPIKEKMPESFFLKGADCFGWATWKNKWNYFNRDGSSLLHQLEERQLTTSFDFNGSFPYTQMLKDQIDGVNNSWAIRWYASAYLNNLLTLYPGRSLIFHNGSDNSGTNAGVDHMLDCKLSETPIQLEKIPAVHHELAFQAFSNFMRKLSKPGIWLRITRRIKRIKIALKTNNR